MPGRQYPASPRSSTAGPALRLVLQHSPKTPLQKHLASAGCFHLKKNVALLAGAEFRLLPRPGKPFLPDGFVFFCWKCRSRTLHVNGADLHHMVCNQIEAEVTGPDGDCLASPAPSLLRILPHFSSRRLVTRMPPYLFDMVPWCHLRSGKIRKVMNLQGQPSSQTMCTATCGWDSSGPPFLGYPPPHFHHQLLPVLKQDKTKPLSESSQTAPRVLIVLVPRGRTPIQ